MSGAGTVVSSLRDLRDADLRAVRLNDARTATRVDRPAHVLAPRHEVQVDVGPPPITRGPVKRLLGFVRRAGPDPAEAIRDAVHVGIDADVLQTPEREDQHEV